METLSFAFGMLSMVGVVLATLIVYSVVKARKTDKQVKELNEWMQRLDQDIWRNIHESHRETTQRIDEMHSEFPRVVNSQITDSVTQCNSYTDKRIDKLVDTYFMVKEAEKEAKKLIKG